MDLPNDSELMMMPFGAAELNYLQTSVPYSSW